MAIEGAVTVCSATATCERVRRKYRGPIEVKGGVR